MTAEAKATFLEESLKVYDELDANKDGQVDRAEVIAAAKAQGHTMSQGDMAQMDEMFAEFDTNKDGKISREEFEAGLSKVFDEMIAPLIEAMGAAAAE